MSKNKLAVIFPGIGYHCDKPLLYHAKKIAAAYGYKVREVPYTGFESGVKGDPEKMHRSFMKAMEQTEKILEDVQWESFADLLFISKSIGTTVAAEYARRHNLITRNIYFTPVGATFRFRPQTGIVFHGTADPWAADAEIEEGCRACGLPLTNIPGTNHSLETPEDPMHNLDVLLDVMKQVNDYIKTGLSPTEQAD